MSVQERSGFSVETRSSGDVRILSRSAVPQSQALRCAQLREGVGAGRISTLATVVFGEVPFRQPAGSTARGACL